MDKFSKQSSAEHAVNPTPSDKQKEAGNYKKGRYSWNGLILTIENPYNSIRYGKGWATRMSAQYGDIKNTIGADGDAIDYYMGAYPESDSVFIVNQKNDDGSFDEHKCMLGFADIMSATSVYQHSYDIKMDVSSIVELSVKEFKTWLTQADKTKPAKKASEKMENRIKWTNEEQPTFYKDGKFVNLSQPQLRYLMASQGGDRSLLTEAVSFDAIYDECEEVINDGIIFDALVLENRLIERKMNILRRAMSKAGSELDVSGEVSVSKPIRKNGTVHIAVVFALSDGQTITIYFHNPDTTPAKLKPDDELISWKWLLNRRDITILVAPERGKDISPRKIASRVMKLAESNAKAFARFNVKAKERESEINALKKEIAEKEATLKRLEKDYDVLKVVNEDLKDKVDAIPVKKDVKEDVNSSESEQEDELIDTGDNLKEVEKAPEVATEAKPEVKPEAKPEVETKAKTEVKPEAKPEVETEDLDKARFLKAIEDIKNHDELDKQARELNKIIEDIEKADGYTLDMFDSEFRRAQDELLNRIELASVELQKEVA